MTGEEEDNHENDEDIVHYELKTKATKNTTVKEDRQEEEEQENEEEIKPCNMQANESIMMTMNHG